MPLITLDDLTIGFRGPPLLDGVSAKIEPGQRIGLLGRNGAGKTTLMKLLLGDVQPDGGRIVFDPGTRVARLVQDVPSDLTGSVEAIVGGGLTDEDGSEEWERSHRLDKILSQMNLDPQILFETLSSGMKRRVLLARALVSQPHLLLLDEPTNHLDIDAILWLEEFLSRWPGTLLFVTHDRSFLQKLANRIWEIDRGRLFDWSCDYATFLERKEAALAAEEKQDALFDKKLAQEEVWIRQGIKARRTRNEGRVRALKELRRQRAERRNRQGSVQMSVSTAEKSGKKVIQIKDLSFSYGDKLMVRDFSTRVMRGDRVGLIGANGSGKSTLLKLMLGQLEPDSGEVELGTYLQIAYFDQHRSVLRDDWTTAENVSEGKEFVEIGGKQKHVIGYLQDFLFTPERARAPITKLSGGERNRLLLAKLFARPSNLLVMDEPTNDLDAETLDLLEALLADYPGTLLLVSHDRDFLDNVITASFVMEGDGRVGEYVGGYSDWKRQAQAAEARSSQLKPETKKAGAAVESEKPRADKPKKLGYKLARELEQLPAKVETLESRMAELTERLNDPALYRTDAEEIERVNAEVASTQAEIDAAYARWDELESG